MLVQTKQSNDNDNRPATKAFSLLCGDLVGLGWASVWIEFILVKATLLYSVYQFRTAVLSVRMFPLLPITADLCCWDLMRALRVL